MNEQGFETQGTASGPERSLGIPPQRGPSEPLTVRSRRISSARTVPARLYSMATGLVVGLLAVGVLDWAQRACANTQTVCTESQVGTMAGLLVLPAVGAIMLAVLRVRFPTRTSLVAVGLLTVVVMLFGLDRPVTIGLAALVTACSVGAFVQARAITARYVVR